MSYCILGVITNMTSLMSSDNNITDQFPLWYSLGSRPMLAEVSEWGPRPCSKHQLGDPNVVQLSTLHGSWNLQVILFKM